MFRTYAMAPPEWILLIVLAALIVPVVEVAKFVYRGTRWAEPLLAPVSTTSRRPPR